MNIFKWIAALLWCFADDDDAGTGVSGAHPAGGSGTDDPPGGGGALDAARQQQQDADPFKTLSDEQLTGLNLTDDQKAAREKGDEVTLSDEQKATLEGYSKPKDGPADGKPEGLPDQFWDTEKKEVKLDALIKSQKDSRKAYEEEREKNKGKHKGTTVKDSSEYTFESTDEVKKSIGREIEADDPALALFSEIAFSLNLTKEEYQKGVETFLTGAKDFMPPQISIEDEMKKLGDNGDAITKSVLNWGESLQKDGLWSEDEFEEIIIMGSTATGISALNKLRQHYGGEKVIPVAPGASGELPSKEELYKKVADPRYQTDPAFRAKTDEEFKKVFGTEEGASSEAGLGVK